MKNKENRLKFLLAKVNNKETRKAWGESKFKSDTFTQYAMKQLVSSASKCRVGE